MLGQRGQPETNVPNDAELVFQHKRPGVEEEIYPLTDGRFNSHFPVMVDGRARRLAGEVDSCVDAVLLRFSEPDELPSHEYLAQVAEPLGRRIWMSHLQPFRLDPRVWVAGFTGSRSTSR